MSLKYGSKDSVILINQIIHVRIAYLFLFYIYLFIYIYMYIYIYIFFFFSHGRFKLQNPLNASQRSGSKSGILHAQL